MTDNRENKMLAEEETQGKKKQKAALGIRPSYFYEETFKELAGEMGLSQTKMFEHILRQYISASREQLNLQSLDCNVELNSIEGAVEVLVKAFKDIVCKAQANITSKDREMQSIKEATNRQIELANIELKNNVEDLTIANDKLQKDLDGARAMVEGYNDIKTRLDESINLKDAKIGELTVLNKEKDKAIKELEKTIANGAKEVKNIEKEVELLEKERDDFKSKVLSLEATVTQLKESLLSFNNLKQVEIQTIKSSIEGITNLKIEKLQEEHAIVTEGLEKELKTKEKILTLKEEEVESLKATNMAKTQEIEHLTNEIKRLKGLKK